MYWYSGITGASIVGSHDFRISMKNFVELFYGEVLGRTVWKEGGESVSQ